MVAFAKLLVLIAIFLLASNANAFTSLSPVAGNQVQENHWFQFVEPMSKPTNESTGEPTNTRVAYSEPKQDAELPSKITDSTITQTCGLCHNKKLEPESLGEQPIAATDSSQNMLPAGLGLHLETPTLLAAIDLSASFNLPVALDLFASFITPAALDPSANKLLSATLDLHLARPSNLSAGHGLCSASTTNLSAALDLHSASCFNSNKMCSAS